MAIKKNTNFKGLTANHFRIEKIEIVYIFRKINETTSMEGRLVVKVKLFANKNAYQSGEGFLEEKDFIISNINPEFVVGEYATMFVKVEDLLISTYPEFAGGEKET